MGQSSTCTGYQPSWTAAIIRNHKNACHDSTIQEKDLIQKLKTTKFCHLKNISGKLIAGIEQLIDGSYRVTFLV